MHNTRKTHNAHNESQRRFAKASENIWWYKAPVSHSRGKVEDAFFTEHKGGRKYFKKVCNRCFRKNKLSKEFNIVNKKVLRTIYDSEWGY